MNISRSWKLIFALVFVGLFSTLPSAKMAIAQTTDDEPVTAEDYSNRGLTYFEIGEYEQAIADYDQAIALDPEFAIAYLNRGLTYFEIGEYEQALADYDQAIVLDPEFATAYLNRGVAYTDLGEYGQALIDLDQAIELDPTDALAYNNRGFLYYQLGEVEQAIADYDQAIELDPELIQAYPNRGAAYNSLGELEQAFADYDQAITLDPELALAYSGRGLAYTGLGEFEQAIADYNQAIELDPTDASAYVNRGIAYLIGYQNCDSTRADWEYYLELVPNAPNADAVRSQLAQFCPEELDDTDDDEAPLSVTPNLSPAARIILLQLALTTAEEIDGDKYEELLLLGEGGLDSEIYLEVNQYLRAAKWDNSIAAGTYTIAPDVLDPENSVVFVVSAAITGKVERLPRDEVTLAQKLEGCTIDPTSRPPIGLIFRRESVEEDYPDGDAIVFPFPDEFMNPAIRGLTEPSISTTYVDSLGTWVSAFAPIFDSQGNSVGAVGIDACVTDVLSNSPTVNETTDDLTTEDEPITAEDYYNRGFAY